MKGNTIMAIQKVCVLGAGIMGAGIAQVAAQAGFDVPPPAATMFAWAPIPEEFRHLGSLEFSKLLIEKADVAVAPGIGFGEHGDEHVRIALVENEHRIRQAARNIKRFLASARGNLHNVVALNARR